MDHTKHKQQRVILVLEFNGIGFMTDFSLVRLIHFSDKCVLWVHCGHPQLSHTLCAFEMPARPLHLSQQQQPTHGRTFRINKAGIISSTEFSHVCRYVCVIIHFVASRPDHPQVLLLPLVWNTITHDWAICD